MNARLHGPVAPGDRIHSLDIIRGFALLGILLMNIEYFQRPMQAVVFGLDASQTGLDYAVGLFVYAFVQGKFYTLFSLLFGLGFVIFLDHALARGAAPRRLFARRLGGLALIGAAHALLVWAGDILLMYALVGFLLLLFVRTPARRLWKWGLAVYLIPVALMWLGALAVGAAIDSPTGPEMMAGFEAQRAQIHADIAHGERVYATGSYAEAVAWRFHELNELYGGGGLLFFTPTVLGLFLIGAAFGRAGVFASAAANAPLFRRMALLGFLAGIPAALYVGANGATVDLMVPSIGGALFMTVASIASLALCLAYAGALMLLLRGGAPARLLARLAPAGRMALTNYLTHSVVFTLLFYGYGLGLWGEFGRAAATGLALALFGLQVWFSGWWLARYRYGPMEWLWRSLTYGRRQPLRAATALP